MANTNFNFHRLLFTSFNNQEELLQKISFLENEKLGAQSRVDRYEPILKIKQDYLEETMTRLQTAQIDLENRLQNPSSKPASIDKLKSNISKYKERMSETEAIIIRIERLLETDRETIKIAKNKIATARQMLAPTPQTFRMVDVSQLEDSFRSPGLTPR